MSAAKRRRSRSDEEDEDEASLSLAAMEAELRPQVMETLDAIADIYKKLRKLQDQQVENRLAAAGTLSPSQDRRLKELQGPADQGGEVAVAQQRTASRRWSSSSTPSTSA